VLHCSYYIEDAHQPQLRALHRAIVAYAELLGDSHNDSRTFADRATVEEQCAL
jgi:hypothetical protein